MSPNPRHSETSTCGESTLRDLKRAVVEFARNASTEVATHDEKRLEALAQQLPAGTAVYVAHTPKASLEDVVRVAIKVRAVGLTPSPHIVARRLPSVQVLRDVLARLHGHDVDRILLVAGDLPRPRGRSAARSR